MSTVNKTTDTQQNNSTVSIAAQRDQQSSVNYFLQQEQNQLLPENIGVKKKANNGYLQSWKNHADIYKSNIKKGCLNSPRGIIKKRALNNSLNAPSVARVCFGTKKKSNVGKQRKLSSAINKKSKLSNKLATSYITTAILLFIFLQTLCLNKTRTGAFHSVNNSIMIDPTVLFDLGGLNTNQIRRGEVFRVFWSIWMHSGWIHLLFNVLCQIQYFLMIEPCWGFYRTSALFVISGVTGNLLSAVCNPCSTTVGSSGALFGLMGSILPYCIEYWTLIPRASLIFTFSAFVLIVSLFLGFNGTTDNWAHIGGMIGGLLFGFSTMTNVSRCHNTSQNKFLLKKKNDEEQAIPQRDFHLIKIKKNQTKGITKIRKLSYISQTLGVTAYRCSVKNCILRSIAAFHLLGLWIILFYFLLFHYTYNPIGKINFYSIRSCCCCYTSLQEKTKQTWTCNYCDATTLSGIQWHRVCRDYQLK